MDLEKRLTRFRHLCRDLELAVAKATLHRAGGERAKPVAVSCPRCGSTHIDTMPAHPSAAGPPCDIFRCDDCTHIWMAAKPR